MPRRGEARLQRLEAQLAPPFEVEARYWRRGLRWVVEACAMIQEAAVALLRQEATIEEIQLPTPCPGDLKPADAGRP